MKRNEYNSLNSDIRMQKIPLLEAENILQSFNNKWIYIKLISNTSIETENSQIAMYNKFKVRTIIINNYSILIYGIEDDDRLVLSKDTLIQSECTFNKDEIKLIQKANNTFNEIYIKDYLPNANQRFDEITNYNKNLIITEGKTDWKHLENALIEFQKQNKYNNLDFEFFKYDEEVPMGNDTLMKICKYQALFKNEYLKVFVFDSDAPDINKEHKSSKFLYHGNNIYSLILPIPSHRKDTPLISIEHYYKDDEIKTYDENGRRLYLVKEFDKVSYKHLTKNKIYFLDLKNKEDNHIIDNKVFELDSDENINIQNLFKYRNKKNVALTKNSFALNILNKVKPFDKISVETFKLFFDVLIEIEKDYNNRNDDSMEISDGVYLKKYDDKSVLHIHLSIKMENALEIKNSDILSCSPIISEDKGTLFLVIQANQFKCDIPIAINEHLIKFLYAKSNNFSNSIELHIYNENNENISNKVLFQGSNSSNIAMGIIFQQL
ncbi:hypothetical protein [Cytobacillus praedii]|uniref:hypothetical protein n=1 Tax=Cytobacillus praedii TaxID=1742358 RepID=UPI000708F608|nr:hypothetical protein [Cytobacillus praedii]